MKKLTQATGGYLPSTWVIGKNMLLITAMEWIGPGSKCSLENKDR